MARFLRYSPAAAMALGTLMVTLILTSCTSGDAEPEPSLETQAAGLLMLGFRGQTVAEADTILADITERGIAGVIIFDRDVQLGTTRNVVDQAQLTALVSGLQDASGGRLLVAIDQEGGAVNRLKPGYGFPPTQRAEFFGALDNPAETRAEADWVAALLVELGINLNLAPVVDLNSNPDSPAIGRFGRSYSADPDVVVRHAREVIAAHQAWNVATALKHFPGHGSATADSHLGFTDVTQTWEPQELVPYRQLLGSDAEITLVMPAHIYHAGMDPEHPATLSQAVITGMLREELGYQGVIISDDLQMRAITDFYGLEQALELTLNAGVDLLIFGNNLDYQPDIAQRAQALIVQLVNEGRVPASRVRAAWGRICDLKRRLDLAC